MEQDVPGLCGSLCARGHVVCGSLCAREFAPGDLVVRVPPPAVSAIMLYQGSRRFGARCPRRISVIKELP